MRGESKGMFLSSDTSEINRQTIEVSSLQYHDVLERRTARAWKQSHLTCPIRTFNVLGGDEEVVLNRDIRISDYHLCEQTLEYVRGAAPPKHQPLCISAGLAQAEGNAIRDNRKKRSRWVPRNNVFARYTSTLKDHTPAK
jgi:hypothetical protein